VAAGRWSLEGVWMSDVKVEYEQTISRDEAAAWLSQLARSFTGEHDAEFPFGPGTVKLHVPGRVRAEVEVEVEDDEVELEIEFHWPLSQRTREPAAASPRAKVGASAEGANGASRSGQAVRTKRR
jgi:amphi-Trp domain-containing protein